MESLSPRWNFKGSPLRLQMRAHCNFLHWESLYLHNHDLWNDSLQGATLREWRQYVDFAKLESLSIQPRLQKTATRMLIKCAMSDQGFQSLTSLTMNFRPPDSHDREKRKVAHYQSVELFLTKLSPLSVLNLSGWHSYISMDSITTNQRSRLRKLDLSCFLQAWHHVNEQDILQLGRHCPLLEDFSVAIHRSKGYRMEVAFYKALGTLRGLKYLNLELDAMNPTFHRNKWTSLPPEQQSAEAIEPPSDPSFDEFDNEITDLYLV